MSYDLALTRPIDTKIIEEDQIVEDDRHTVILNRPMNSVSDAIVRINDFARDRNHQTESLIREDVTDQFNGNEDTIFVVQGPIYDGLKVGNVSNNPLDVVVKINVEDEDVSEQFTGSEDYFVTEGKALLRSNKYDFDLLTEKEDVEIKINGTSITSNDIFDISPIVGKIQLNDIPLSTDTVTVSYSFKAKIDELDARNSKIVLKEKPKSGQEVYVAYYARVNDGWTIEESQRSLIENARDIIFTQQRNISRIFVENEDVSSQFDGTTSIFYVEHIPMLPLYQNFATKLSETLNNAIRVFINGESTRVASVNAETGKVALFAIPKSTDQILVNYYYDNGAVPDRISVDYTVERKYCDKCSLHIGLADYLLNSLGNYTKIYNEDKLIQDLKKIVITERGSDPVATWYGTIFISTIGGKHLADFVKTRASGEIIEALTRLKNAQIQQEEYQEVTDNEFLDFIQNIEVEQNEEDPTYFRVEVDVVTQAGSSYTVDDLIYPGDLLY